MALNNMTLFIHSSLCLVCHLKRCKSVYFMPLNRSFDFDRLVHHQNQFD